MSDKTDSDSRWPTLLAFAAIAVLNFYLPDSIRFGNRWLMPGLVVVLVAITAAMHAARKQKFNHLFGLILNVAVTFALITSVVLLVKTLPQRTEQAVDLLIAGASLWLCNILVFASWYWRLDAGGPNLREKRESHDDGAFLFPQMALHPEAPAGDQGPWSPEFVDYLFLAYNTSTALSPTDTQVLSRWAKLLMMLQSSISLCILVLLLARGVNIL
jgi:uncharacterized membrane protein